jgi:hypothetical protein
LVVVGLDHLLLLLRSAGLWDCIVAGFWGAEH